jgi:2'-5' RNA ligase
VDRLVAWESDAFGAVSGVRPVPAQHLHVTLAFLGHRPVGELDAIVGTLREAAARAAPARLELRGYRETRSVGMLRFGDEEGRATALADDLQGRLEALGVYERERRRWLPHVTVLRFRQRPRLRPALPELEPFVPSDAAAYLSRLRPGGAQYEVLEAVPVGGR